MFEINSELVSPDLKNLRNTVELIATEGIKIKDTTDLEKRLDKKLQECKNELLVKYGIRNPNSSRQVIDVLMEMAENDFPCIGRICYDDRKGKWSSDKEKLAELKKQGVPIAFTLSKYREVNNTITTLRTLRSLSDSDSMVHPKISYGRTGRVNYSEPALMSINSKILWNVVGPRTDDFELYSIDIKNQEPWILINSLGVGSLVQVLKPGKSLYDCIFEYWYGHLPNPDERAEFKTAWNALTYGASKKLVEGICKVIDYDIIYHNFNNIEELKKYRSECTSMGFSSKRECSTYFGTRLECDAPRGMALARQQMDYRIQGTGVDILALLLEHFEERVEHEGLEEYMYPYLFRHDEIVVAVSKNLIGSLGHEHIEEFLRDTFEHKIDEWLPFNVDIELAKPNDNIDEWLES